MQQTPRERYEIQVKLHDGRMVGSWSREWLIECEALHLLSLPLQDRRKALEDREKKRGVKATNELRNVMRSIFEARRSVLRKIQ